MGLIKPRVREYHSKKEHDFNNWIEACRWIVRNHQALVVDEVLIDAQSAALAITVYEALNEKNRERALFISPAKFIEFAWKYWHSPRLRGRGVCNEKL